MKKIYISVALLAAAYAQAQVGFGTSTPHKSAQIDIDSNNKGLLMPRVELVSLTNGVTPINTPADGLLVYNTKVDTTEKLEKGFYVWEGTTWKRFATQNEVEAVSYWKAQATNTTGGSAGRNASGASTGGVQPFNTNTPVDVDIYQKGRVGIGYESSYNIDFEVNKTQKQLEVGGDFRTSHHYINTTDATQNSYFGFETNSIALPSSYAVRGNILYNAETKNLEDYSYFDRVYDGSMLLQSKDELMYLARTGVETNAAGAKAHEIQNSATGSSEFISHYGTTVSKQVVSEFNLSEFVVFDRKKSDVKFGLDFNRGNFFIGDNDGTGGYYFPNRTGTNKQILQLNAAQKSLEWKNPLDILTPGSANQVLVTNPTGNGVTWVDQSTIVPTTTVSNALSGSSLTTTVNGVDATPLDLGPMIQAAQNTSSVVEGVTTSVSSTKTGNNTAYTVEVKDEAITTEKLADNAVTSDKIVDGTIATADLANGAVTAEKLKADASDAGKVGVVQSNGTVVYQNISATNVTGVDLTAADGATATIEVASGGTAAVLIPTSLRVKAESITSAQIKDGSITGADIADKTITGDKLDAGTGNEGKVPVANADGTVTYQNISSANVDGKNLTAGDGSITVSNGTGATLVDANVKVTTGGISTDKLANNAITTDKIAAGAVESSDIKAGAVTNDKLTAGTGTDGRVGIANAAGNVTYTDINTVVQGAQKLETVSVGNGITLTPTTNGNTTDFNVKLKPGSTGQVLTTQTGTSGVETQWKNLEDLGISSTPKFFYMPSVVLPTILTDSRITASGNYTVAAGVFTVKLYELFKGQFTSPIKSSSATSTLDEFVKVATSYDYFVTYADEAVFTDITLDANGVLTYKVNPNAIIKTGSFMNIVLKVK
ncbi:hypothetical protein H1R17_12730 [Flavobacterium sp. xlx-214]|uniref:hypothetical protein n=1 Tax=unclassified Flavobacterium TaxID=196869 RepID=UPI0013D0E621|nr:MULTISPECIES: hypothetical protein [unclassified Flavobacterium]MBA5791544.1 hypothetical protein [Flavobacterium sp. xlx-221]QMI83306.1 hypothetical protein H1R17_12730 [Flavobacterium sp. xlx-214]